MSPATMSLLLEYGFAYDSSLMADDYTPYRVRVGDILTPDVTKLGKTTRLIEMPVSWSLDDFPHFEPVRLDGNPQAGLRRTDDVLANLVDDFRFMAQELEDGVMTYTFHPLVIGRGHRMLMLARLIDELRSLGATFDRLDHAAAEFARSPAHEAIAEDW